MDYCSDSENESIYLNESFEEESLDDQSLCYETDDLSIEHDPILENDVPVLYEPKSYITCNELLELDELLSDNSHGRVRRARSNTLAEICHNVSDHFKNLSRKTSSLENLFSSFSATSITDLSKKNDIINRSKLGERDSEFYINCVGSNETSSQESSDDGDDYVIPHERSCSSPCEIDLNNNSNIQLTKLRSFSFDIHNIENQTNTIDFDKMSSQHNIKINIQHVDSVKHAKVERLNTIKHLNIDDSNRLQHANITNKTEHIKRSSIDNIDSVTNIKKVQLDRIINCKSETPKHLSHSYLPHNKLMVNADTKVRRKTIDVTAQYSNKKYCCDIERRNRSTSFPTKHHYKRKCILIESTV